jgi:hypothetical protein
MSNARSVIKRLRFPLDIMLLCVRWYVAYPLSLRNLEVMMQERGLFVDHSTIHRWVIKLVPVLEEAFRKTEAQTGTGEVCPQLSSSTHWRHNTKPIAHVGQERAPLTFARAPL